MAEEFEQTIDCQMCGTPYLAGRHHNDGRHIAAYDLHVCLVCYDCNAQGWAPLYEQKLIPHLAHCGITQPKRNQKGLFPRD